MKGLDLSKFKKIGSDEHVTHMQHPDGHTIQIAHKALSPAMRRQLQKIPSIKMSEGGDVNPQPSSSPSIDPDKAKDVQAGATSSGWQPDTWKKNLKEGLGLADGGEVRKSPPQRAPASDRKAIEKESAKEGPVDYEVIKAKHPVYAEPLADGGEVADSGGDDVQAAPQQQPPVTVNVNEPSPESPPVLAPQAVASPQGVQPQLSQAVKSAVPPPQPAAPQAQDSPGLEGYKNQIQGTAEAGRAQADLADKQSNILTQQQVMQQKTLADYERNMKQLADHHAELTKGIQEQKINPNQYWENKSTFGRISSAIGLILGGIGAGLTHTENPVLEMINKNIDRDIESQKAQLGKRESLLNANFKQYGNLRDATDATKLQQMGLIQTQLQKAQSQAASPLAKANAQKSIGEIQQAMAPIANQLAMRQTLQQNPEMAAQNPSKAVALVVPQKDQAAAYKEIQEASSLGAAKKNILDAFQQVAALQSTGNRLMNPVQSGSQISALVDPLIAGLSKETAGRFTEQDAKYLSTLFPKLTDNDESKALKFKAINNLVSQKLGPNSFPILTANNIPISGLVGGSGESSQQRQPASQASVHPEQQAKIIEWAKANPTNPKAKLVLEKIRQ